MDTKAIRDALAGATPGPWLKSAHDDNNYPTWDIWAEKELHPSQLVALDIHSKNANLIANAPTWLQQLLDNDDQKTQLLERINAEFDRFMSLLNITIETHPTVDAQAKAFNNKMSQLLDENTKLKDHLESEQQDLGDLHELYVQEGAALREKAKQLLDENERLTETNKALESDNYNHVGNLDHLAAEVEQLQADKAVVVAEFKHIVEYWNRDQNETAMADALWHIIETAESALERIESGEKE